MAQEIIDFGAYPNDPDSDAIRVAFQKVQNNFTELFSVQYQTGVSQVLEGAGISLNTNTGNVTVTNRIANITIQTDANLLIGVTTASSNTATINSGTTPFVLNLSNSISTGNITATGNLQGVFGANSSSQPNITSIGNLGNLSVVGTIRSNSLVANSFNTLNFNATYMAAPGSNNQVLFNNLGNIDATSNLTFNGNTLIVTGAISATGNVTGLNFINTGTIAANGIISSNANITSNSNISAAGNVIATNFVGRLSSGTSNISIATANGNINLSSSGNANVMTLTGSGANINGYANITGVVNVGSLSTGNTVSATGNVTGGNFNTSGLLSATGNITGSSILSLGIISATGNVVGQNILTSGAISAVGNINASLINTGNLSATGMIFATSNIATNGGLSVTGNIIAGNLNTSIVNAAGNMQGANLLTTGLISAIGNLTANTALLGNSVTANFFIGSGANLSNLNGSNITGAVSISNLAYFANITATANANVVNFIPFVNTTSGNANLIADSFLSYNSNTKVLSANALNIAGNIVAGNLNVSSGTLTGRTLTTGANTTSGNITGNWILTAGSLLQSTYADLAEYYSADSMIDSGTVVEFGGMFEIKTCDLPMSQKVAGIVTSEPAYVMNSLIDCAFPVAVALQGRVPTKVTGIIQKGDMMVSAGNGLATACNSPTIGSVLGKALQDFNGVEGIIEIAIGRL
jgi:hypothetical protein